MSKGLGRIQRRILEVADHEAATERPLKSWLDGDSDGFVGFVDMRKVLVRIHVPDSQLEEFWEGKLGPLWSLITRSQYVSFCRAVKSLEDKGLLESRRGCSSPQPQNRLHLEAVKFIRKTSK